MNPATAMAAPSSQGRTVNAFRRLLMQGIREGLSALDAAKALTAFQTSYYAPEGRRPASCAPATRRLKARDRRQAWPTTASR